MPMSVLLCAVLALHGLYLPLSCEPFSNIV